MLSNRLKTLDALRVFAAGCVLFAHGGALLFVLVPYYDIYALAGWFGTELFFALAGFLLVRQLLASPPRLADVPRWWLWRAWRILPLFWVAMLLHLVIAWWLGNADAALLPHYTVLAQNLAWPHPTWFQEAWNLPVLALFFVVAPLLAWCVGLGERRADTLCLTLIGWIALGVAARGVWTLHTDPAWDEGVRKIVLARIDACAYGGVFACLLARGARVSARAWSTIAVVAWVLAAAGFFAVARDNSEVARIGLFMLSGIAAAATVAAAAAWSNSHSHAKHAHEPSPTSRSIAALARWSYPLYLVNMPLLLILLGAGMQPSATWAIPVFVVWIAGAIALAGCMHRMIEAPLIGARSRRLVSPRDGLATPANRRSAKTARDRSR